jgi:plastocyanin
MEIAMTVPCSLRVLRAAMMAGFVATALSSGSALAEDATVNIESFMFMPAAVNIHAGETVTWKNMDEEPHTVTSNTGLFRSGGIDGGGSYSFKFEKPGVYRYSCSIHPQMTGTITVQ